MWNFHKNYVFSLSQLLLVPNLPNMHGYCNKLEKSEFTAYAKNDLDMRIRSHAKSELHSTYYLCMLNHKASQFNDCVWKKHCRYITYFKTLTLIDLKIQIKLGVEIKLKLETCEYSFIAWPVDCLLRVLIPGCTTLQESLPIRQSVVHLGVMLHIDSCRSSLGFTILG